jgi:hypothetical protein
MRTLRLSTLLTVAVALTACGSDRVPSGSTTPSSRDAAVAVDAARTPWPDASTPALDAGTSALDASAPSPLCDTYCLESQFHCDGANSYFATPEACRAYCATLALGTAGDQTGDTLHCRLYWVDQPSAMDPVTNCPKAAPTSPVCD